MAFSSIPAYLDSSNWQQQQNHHQIIGSSGGGLNPLLPAAPQHLSGPHPLTHGGGGGTGGSIRPGSMAERARLANIPLPEPALECPRCESTNTKFCYFNNYNLSQPRHFCKACRRYWTRGGALRSVPIGGGCRRNKKSKFSANSKSAVTPARQTTATNITDNNNNNNNDISTTAATMLGLPPLRFMSPLSQFTENLVGGDHQMGFNTYNGITATTSDMNYHGSGGSHFPRDIQIMSSGSGTNIEPWQLQHQEQFPFMGVLDQSSSPGIYQFQGSHPHHQVGGRPKFLVSSKTEERPPQELNLSRQLLGGGLRPQALTNQQWNNYSNNNSEEGNWTGFSSFNSSSTSKLL